MPPSSGTADRETSATWHMRRHLRRWCRVRNSVGSTNSLGAMAEPGGSGPIGPYPPGVETDEQHDEYDRLRRRVLWKMPSGLYVLGSTDGGERRNGMTINWVTQLSFSPKLIGVAVELHAYTHELIEAGHVFCVNFVDREDRAI